MQNEIWKDIPNYEGMYQVSNLGRVKSLSRLKSNRNGSYLSKEKVLKPYLTGNYIKYKTVKLGLKGKNFKIHQLVAMAFLNHTPCGYKLVVDHKNDNPLDNRLENLQVVTQRHNTCKSQGRYLSQYKGVTWCKTRKKWVAKIRIGNKHINLGRFTDEYEAYLAYQNKLKEIENG